MFLITIIMFSRFLSVSAQESAPTAILSGKDVKRFGAEASDKTTNNTIKTGKEILEWEKVDLPEGVYNVEMSVRTGNNKADHLNIVEKYFLELIDSDGEICDSAKFVLKPGTKPIKASEKYPVFMGEIVGRKPVFFKPGMRVRARAESSWAMVNEIRFYSPEEKDLVCASLLTPRKWRLFRRGESMPVICDIKSYSSKPVKVMGKVKLESPYGKIVHTMPFSVELPPQSNVDLTVKFPAKENGLNIAILNANCGENKLNSELSLSVVSAPKAGKIADSSPFGLHPSHLDDLFQTGFKWVRLWDSADNWCNHEQSGKGNYDFAKTESKVNHFIDQGFNILAVLAYSPKWASTDTGSRYYNFPPKNIEDWKDYCREVMTHFKGRINYYEVWNEPNCSFFRGTAKEYVTLLKAAFAVAREVDPNIRILGGSGTGDFLTWTESILKEGAGPYMDIMSFHAYTTPNSPEKANLEGRLGQLKEIMKKYGIDGKDIWNTEVGQWTDRRTGVRPATQRELLAKAPANLSPNWQAGWPYRPIPETDAAAFAVRHYYLNIAQGIDKLFWYSCHYVRTPLICRDKSLRLTCLAVASAANELNGATYWKQIDFGLKKLHLHLWKRGEETIGVLWYAGKGTKDILLPGADKISAVDIWGNPISLQRNDEGVVFEATGNPATFHASAEAFEKARPTTRELRIPVDNCRVVKQANPERPVKEHTSEPHHGNRRVFGLPNKGDAIAWSLKSIKPGLYRVLIEMRTGVKGDIYKDLSNYEVSVNKDKISEKLRMEPTEVEKLLARVPDVANADGRAYGFAQSSEPIWLQVDDEIQVSSLSRSGFVGDLILKEVDPTSIVYSLANLDSQVKIDGSLSETEKLKAFNVDQKRQVAMGVADPFASISEKDAWEGVKDLSAKFWAARSGGFLYAAVEIQDGGGLFPPPESKGAYTGDSVELFLDFRLEKEIGSSVMGENVFQLMLRAPSGETNSEIENGKIPGSKAIAKQTENGWLAEFLVPLGKSSEKRLIGLDIAINDDDDGKGRKSQIIWHGNSQNFQDPSVYGRCRLP